MYIIEAHTVDILMDDKKKLKILAAALEVFFKYGFRCANMQDIAGSAGISRPALYMYFKSKEDVFTAALVQYAHEIIEEINNGLEAQKTARDKILFAFEIWAIRNFDHKSTEAREFSEYSHDFARDAIEKMYAMFEKILVLVLNSSGKSKSVLPANRTAHLMTSAVRGFKIVARNSAEMRKMVGDLVTLVV
jgi:TetR/AcrR family transcriptional regulator of autoinduction and epiphytic fitness